MRVVVAFASLTGILTTHALGVVLRDDVIDDDDIDGSDADVFESTRGRWSAGFSRNCMDKVGTETPFRKAVSAVKKPGYNQVLPPWPPAKMEPKLAMLMFVGERLFNPDLWVAWLEQAERHNLSFHLAIHTKSATPTLDHRLMKYLHREHVQNDKCNLWDAQWALINPLIENEVHSDITHFMMLSENSVPVKPLRQIYVELKQQPLSRLCIDDNFERPRAETWWTIRRDDMQWFHKYNSTIYRHHGRGCIDENLWYSALKKRRRKWPVQGQILDQCWMYVNWRLSKAPTCKDWKRVAEATHTPELDRQPCLNATSGHPVTWYNISARAFDELYDSPHWFARKFADGAVPNEVASRMLKQ